MRYPMFFGTINVFIMDQLYPLLEDSFSMEVPDSVVLYFWLVMLPAIILYYRKIGARSQVRATAEGLAEEDKAVAFSALEQIYYRPFHDIPFSDSKYFYLVYPDEGHKDDIDQDDRPTQIYIKESDVLKVLPWTSFNRWRIEWWSVEMRRGEPGEGFQASFGSFGRFAWGKVWLFYGLIALASIEVVARVDLLDGIYSFIALLAMVALLALIAKVRITITESGVWMADRFLPFTDVIKVEKGLFRTNVTTKNGEVWHFPQACHLLPELMNELIRQARLRPRESDFIGNGN